MKKNIQALLYEAFAFIAILIIIILFWDSIFWSTIFAFLLTAIGFVFFHTKEDITFFMVAALLGPVIEISMIAAGIYSYGHPVFWGIAPWTPILWGFAFLLGRRIRDTIFKFEHWDMHYSCPKNLPSLWVMVIYDLAIITIATIVTTQLWHDNILTAILLLIIVLLNIIRFHRRADLFFIGMVLILGSITEIVCSYGGAWEYVNPSFLKIPLWAPFGYAVLALFFRRLSVLVSHCLFHPKQQVTQPLPK